MRGQGFSLPSAPGASRAADAIEDNTTTHVPVVEASDMRFVFLDNDTKLLFATAYDGDWDPYIEDFAAKIPVEMDVLFSAFQGWPGIRSPEVKDWIAKHQLPAVGWYVAHPDLTVRDIRQLKRVGKAVDEFLDKIGG